jgi:cytidylate kinase
VRAAIEQRDHLDTTREVSPLRAADDARHLDTSDQSIDEVIATIAGWARQVGA